MQRRYWSGWMKAFLVISVLVQLAFWVVGGFLLAPIHCSSAICDVWGKALDLSVVSALAGLALVAVRPLLPLPSWLVLGAACLLFVIGAVEAYRARLSLGTAIDAVLLAVVAVLLIRDGRSG